MSDQPQQPNTNDEVDLIQLFRIIGKGFNRIFNFIGSILNSLFSIIIYALKPFVIYFKIIIISLVVAGILGYTLDMIKPKIYSSRILVKPYFDSKYQLVSTINYYNALIADENYQSLSNIFELSETEVQKITGFEINMGPETENDRIIEFNNFLKGLDSTRASSVTYEDFVENRSIYSGNLFEIEVFSLQKNIFSKLENGIGNSFMNKYSEKKMKKRDSLIAIQKETLKLQLEEVGALQEVYIRVLEEESKSTSTEINLGGEGLSLNKDKTQTKEFELLNKEIQLRNELKSLDEKKVEEDVFFDVIASFQEVGTSEVEWYKRYTIVLPVLVFILLCFVYLTKKVVPFIKNYEA